VDLKVACILLAAGRASRMRGRNKLLLKIGNETLVRRAASVVRDVQFDQVIAVSCETDGAVFSALEPFPFKRVQLTNPDSGMHATIKCGLTHLAPKVDAFFVCFADQPFLTTEIFRTLMKTYPRGLKNKILYAQVGGTRKQPVLIGADFIPEILNHEDGDYGCSYLFNRHPDSCIPVNFENEEPFQDIDTPEDFQNALKQRVQGLDPISTFHELSLDLRFARIPHVVATVIEVIGSASAKIGSKAIFNEKGDNLLGWVGGGCAEQHVAEQSVQALNDKRARIIEADLDDEIFGLGVACGGKMNLFLEPIFPAEKIPLETNESENAIRLGIRYGLQVEVIPTPSRESASSNWPKLFTDLAGAIAKKRGKTAHSLRDLKDLPVQFKSLVRDRPAGVHPSTRVTIVGSTRITEALAWHFQVLGFTIRRVGPLLRKYGEEDGPEIAFEPGESVIVASHTSRDPEIVAKALKTPISYLAMLGSRKRALDVFEILNVSEGAEVTDPLYIPAGIDIDARNPDEVALSIVVECLHATGFPYDMLSSRPREGMQI